MRTFATTAVLAVALAACGGDEKSTPEPDKGKVVRGETDRGMKLTVQTFAKPSDFPQLAKLEAYREVTKYPAVDYHRITGDNTAGSVPDQGRSITFADTAEEIVASGGIPTRFSCDVLQYEWPPPQGASDETRAAYDELMTGLCADGPPKEDGIAPGESKVYFVVSDRGFGTRGIADKRVFGPLNAELK